ncbi:MAG: MFS transporter [Dehalococcoidia bacterium]
MNLTSWRSRLARYLPLYYGWVIAANTVAVSLSTRTIMAVATLSVFVVPMTEQLGWSRGMFSGAVSVGNLCAVVVAPWTGKWIDRYGSGMLLAASSLVTGFLALALSFISHPFAFYAFYVPGRMIFSGPLELGLPTAISNWFIRRRPLGLAVDGVAKGGGLVLMPLLAQFIISGWDWRTAWIVLGIICFAVGVVPSILLMARRPEDLGLEPDPVPRGDATAPLESDGSHSTNLITTNTETNFTVRQALNTRAFYILAGFSAAGLMVQAGVSLHQVSHYINQGLSAPAAALSASTFAFAQMIGGPFWSALGRSVPIRFLLASAAGVVGAGALSTISSDTLPTALGSAFIVGFGVAGLHLLLRLAWADYYGRENLGAIRGLTLSAQIGGQAVGPVLAGFMFDATDSYQLPFRVFAGAALLAGLLVLAATPPKSPVSRETPETVAG